MSKGNVLLLGGYLGSLRAAKQAGLTVLYVQKKENFHPDCIGLADQALMMDYLQEDLLKNAVMAFHVLKPLQAIVTFSEDALLPAARLAQSLGIKHHKVELVELLKDKYKMRTLLSEKQFSTVAFAEGRSLNDVLDFGNLSGYPMIIKPVQGSGSYGVLRLNDAEEARASIPEWLRHTKLETFLIEEYVSGTEISVESFTMGTGNHRIVAMTDKWVSTHFVEQGHCIPAVLSATDQARVETFVQQFLSLVGLEYGPAHTELKITSDRIAIIESHNRVGGDSIFRLAELVTGIDMVLWTFELLSGQELTMKERTSEAAAIQFLQLPEGAITDVQHDLIPQNDQHLVEYHLAVKSGQHIKSVKQSTDRLGYVLATGKSSEDAYAHCERLSQQIQSAINYEPDSIKSKNKHILFVEMNESSHGPDALRKAHALGYDITFLTIGLEHYQEATQELISEVATQIIVVNTYDDFDVLIEKVIGLHAKNPFSGVYASSDFEVETAARITDELHLPGHSFEAVQRTRNKALMRKTLDEAGIAQPKFHVIHSEEEIAVAIARLEAAGAGFPLVLKPVDSSASDGVQMVHSISDIQIGYRNHLRDRHFRRGYYKDITMILEEYLPGDLVSVETILTDNGPLILGMTGRVLSELPYFVELEASYPESVANQSDIYEFVLKAVEALGLTHGPLHIELINGDRGPQMVEVNVRLVGSYVNKLISKSREVDTILELMKMTTGEPFDFGEFNRGFGICYMIEPSRSGKIECLHVSDDLNKVPGFMQIKLHKMEGDIVKAPVQSNFDVIATITAFCTSKEASYACIRQCLEQIKIEISHTSDMNV